jgi:XTP/dITP diphosphohydrolase
LVIAENGAVLGAVSGRVWGRIAKAESGKGGFGYDSIFLPKGYKKTFGQLPGGTKHRISHRARAVTKLKARLSRIISSLRAKDCI